MITEYFKVGIQIDRRNFLAIFLFYFTIYNCYYVFFHTLKLILEIGSPENNLIFAVFYFSIAFSTLLVGCLNKRIHSVRIIYAWATIMPILVICLLFFSDLYPIITILSGILIGIVSWAYSIHFINETLIEERGRLAGIITGLSLFVTPLLLLLANNILNGLIICIILTLCTFISKFLKIPEKKEIVKTDNRHLSKTDRKSFILLIVSLFLLYFDNVTFVNVMTSYLFDYFIQFQLIAGLLQMLFISIGAISFGALVDWVGRKNILVITFSLFGIGTCFSGLYPTAYSFLILSAIVGFCWGVFLNMFLLVIWGEILNGEKSGLKMSFGIGLSIYHFASGVGLLIIPFLQISLFEAAILNAVTIFSSIIMLSYVKETLPAGKASEMKRRLYYERIKKIVKDEAT